MIGDPYHKLGGDNRAQKLTPAQRQRIAREGGWARADTLSAKRRREIARLGAAIRWGMKKAAAAPEKKPVNHAAHSRDSPTVSAALTE